jgi:hypothetical protein
MAYERNGDSGIDNVANTRPPSRPRATGVAAVFPDEAVVRDYEAAKLRATPMTERLYAPQDYATSAAFSSRWHRHPCRREGDADVR